MLSPRWEWNCDHAGCCVFVGGTEDYDSYTLYLETGRCWKNHSVSGDPLTEEEIELAKAMMVCFGGTDA